MAELFDAVNYCRLKGAAIHSDLEEAVKLITRHEKRIERLNGFTPQYRPLSTYDLPGAEPRRVFEIILLEELEDKIFASTKLPSYEECERPARWIMMFWGNDLPVITKPGEDLVLILFQLAYILHVEPERVLGSAHDAPQANGSQVHGNSWNGHIAPQVNGSQAHGNGWNGHVAPQAHGNDWNGQFRALRDEYIPEEHYFYFLYRLLHRINSVGWRGHPLDVHRAQVLLVWSIVKAHRGVSLRDFLRSENPRRSYVSSE
ncbi:hypothetical protein FPOA_03436 [Fusarium poae]|uniref:Uncharacterized protein n=1 Tax=Fusarium poae TaxID=36050 RepID=A0A1B8B9V2_FUSPO|nr:hypothetical protein FPOA_03436 [Fusarium poae]